MQRRNALLTNLREWAHEMDRAAEGCAEAGAPPFVEANNRLVAQLLREAAWVIDAIPPKQLFEIMQGMPR